jgi:tRNA uridine 5-carbamoylmethylation protein Kti12
MAHLILVRGLPGSGKSTYAQKLMQWKLATHHFEADMWMVDENGQYKYDRYRLAEVHTKCLEHAIDAACLAKYAVVVIANTFAEAWQLGPYLQFAIQFSHKFTVINMPNLYESTHNVPPEEMARMRSKWEKIPDMDLQF